MHPRVTALRGGRRGRWQDGWDEPGDRTQRRGRGGAGRLGQAGTCAPAEVRGGAGAITGPPTTCPADTERVGHPTAAKAAARYPTPIRLPPMRSPRPQPTATGSRATDAHRRLPGRRPKERGFKGEAVAGRDGTRARAALWELQGTMTGMGQGPTGSNGARRRGAPCAGPPVMAGRSEDRRPSPGEGQP